MPAKKAASKKAVTGQAAGKAAADGGDAQAGRAAAKKAGAKKAAAGKDPAEAAVVEGETVGGKRKAEGAGAVKKGAEGVAGQGAGGTSTTSKSAAGPGTARTGAVTQDTAGSSTAKKAGAAEAAPQTGATTVGAKKTPGTATAAKTAVPKARAGVVEPGELAVRPGEDPWTAEEVEEARSELMSEEARLREEISSSERSLAGLMRDSGDGAGHDEADTGSKNITREHELALAANAREMLDQTERALDRLDSGTYGLCENCGNPIGKARMQAFPRATLCVECKQKQERRY
ncbi:TraR/DksA family transcriptional regulator [Streptomyces sp. NPDC057837]|uniref:TraR/DksA family transcriptional regulator n=1 Tax=Streptomyces sp. NPDC057837 TaxID=3346260 RepID=UPI0036839C03